METSIKEILDLSEEQLLIILGEDLIQRSAFGAFPILGPPIDVSIKWLEINRHLLCARIANSERARAILMRPDGFERIELIASLIDAFTMFTKMAPVAVLSAIIAHRGCRAFCGAELLVADAASPDVP